MFLNKAVVEYYKSDFKKTDQFEKSLTSICDQVSLLYVLSNSLYIILYLLKFKIHLDKLEDIGHCIVFYNKVVLLYHRREYTAALEIIEKLYKFIEAMGEYTNKCVNYKLILCYISDDKLARKICFLAAELQLIIKMPDEALNKLTYIEDHLNDVKKQGDPKDSSDKVIIVI